MAEGEKDGERQAIVFNLFPIKEQSVLTAFQAVTLENLDEEKRILFETNPHVSNSFNELTEAYSGDVDQATQTFLGILICYKALQEEAKSRVGALPILSYQFVKTFDAKRERMVGMAEDELLETGPIRRRFGGTQTLTRQQIRRANLHEFRNFEPEFSRIAEERFGKPEWTPEDDFRYQGIIKLYLLFREGAVDPKNFQVSPIQTP